MQSTCKTSADDVAQAIYNAATDGTKRLRYFTGEDVGGIVKAKREMPDEEYMELMRSRILTPG